MQERGVKALEKRIAGLQALLLASTILNLAIGAAAGPLRRVAFAAATIIVIITIIALGPKDRRHVRHRYVCAEPPHPLGLDSHEARLN